VIAAIDAAARAVPSTTTRIDWEACDAFDRLGALEAVRVPTLVLVGEADTLTPRRYAEHLAAHIAGAQLAVLEGVGHWAIVEAADRAATLIADFAERL
jgi:pimeloyl-ACP methyl ester carboxylesterase